MLAVAAPLEREQLLDRHRDNPAAFTILSAVAYAESDH